MCRDILRIRKLNLKGATSRESLRTIVLDIPAIEIQFLF